MALETQLIKIAANLQQLTDAIVTHTAALEMMQVSGGKVNPIPVVVNSKSEVTMGKEIPADRETVETIVGVTETIAGKAAHTIITDEIADATVVDIHKNETSATPDMDIQQANSELNDVVGKMGDGGQGIRDLLKKHNAITLAQINPTKYKAFVDEARALLTVSQA